MRNNYQFEGEDFIAVDVAEEPRFIRFILRDQCGNYKVISERKTLTKKGTIAEVGRVMKRGRQ